MAALLARHPIAYIKWDHNRDLTTAGLANGTPGYHAQVLAAYAAASEISSHVLVERFIPGHDYRLLVVGDQLVAAARGAEANFGSAATNIIQMNTGNPTNNG